MDTFTAIETRRSIRKFKEEPISPELLEKILRAATMAPSGKKQATLAFLCGAKEQAG